MEVKEIVGIGGGRGGKNRRIMSFPLLYFPGKSQPAGFLKTNSSQPGCEKYPCRGKLHIGPVSMYVQSRAISLAAREEKIKKDDAYSLPSYASPAGATSKPILTGKITDRPKCDFAWVRRFNPSALCPNVNNCQNHKCSRMESGSMRSFFPPSFFLLIQFLSGLLNLKTSA